MRSLFFFLLTMSMLFTACPDDKALNGSVELVFKATYEDEPLVVFDQVYTYPDGTPIKFQLLNYFVSDITLLRDGDEEGELITEVALIDYSDFYDVETATAGYRITYDDIKPGVYSSIRLGLGLTPALNGTRPEDYMAGHPMADNYWSWARGYVFAKIEANADLDGDGQFSDKLTYHIGEDELFTTLVLNKPIVIEENETASIDFTLDMHDILENEGNYLDITEVRNTLDHTNNVTIYGWLWDNLVRSFEANN